MHNYFIRENLTLDINSIFLWAREAEAFAEVDVLVE